MSTSLSTPQNNNYLEQLVLFSLLNLADLEFVETYKTAFDRQ